MKVIHITAKVLLKVVSIALIAILAISVLPIVAGGIGVDVKDDPKATLVGDKIEITGTFVVDNNLMWDITDFSYGVTINNDIFTAASAVQEDVLISKGTKTELPFHLEIPLADVLIMMIGGAVGPGGSIGDLTIPMTLNVGGSYIQRLVGFDVSISLSSVLETPIPGTITYNETTGELSGEVHFEAGGILEGLTDIDLNVPITAPGSSPPVSGHVRVVIDASGNAVLTFGLAPATDEDLLVALEGSTIEIDNIPLSDEQSEQFVKLMEHIIDMIEAVP